jgi:hypothetical protein
MIKKIRDPIISLVVFILGLLILSIYFYYQPENYKTILNYISYFGTYISIFGLLITYAQIMSVKEIAESTNLKVEETLNKTFKILIISELTKAIKLVQEIQNYLVNNKYEAGVIRLKDLKNILIQLKHHEIIKEFTKSSEYRQVLINISVNTTNITQHLNGTKVGINSGKIIGSLEEIENLLAEMEGHLKFKNHE